MLERGGCEDRSTAPLYSRSVRCDELNFRSSTPTFGSTAKLQHIRLSRSSVYRLVARFKRRPTTSSLLPAKAGRPGSLRLHDPRVEAIIEEAIQSFYLTPQRPGVIALMRRAVSGHSV